MMKKFIVLMMLLTVLLLSCERYIDSNDPIRPEPAESTAPTNLVAELNNETIALSWDMTDTDGVLKYYVYASENNEDNYLLIDTTYAMSITLSDLKINFRYYFKVAAVYSGNVAGPQSESVTALASYLSLTIANDKEYINTRNTTVQIVGPNTATHIILSEDSTFAGASYQSYSSQKSFEITSDGDGTKFAYARLQFNDGSVSGQILSDSVILDTKADIVSVTYQPDGTIFGPGDTIILVMDAGEPDGTATASFNGSGTINLVDDGTEYDPFAGDGIYHGWYKVPVVFDLYEGTVTGNFTDRAGNRATAVTAYSKLNINTPPDEVTLSAYLTQSADSVVFNWTASTSNDFSRYRLVTNTSSSVNENSEIIYESTAKNTTTVKLAAVTGTRYYKIYVYDRFDESAGSNTVTITK